MRRVLLIISMLVCCAFSRAQGVDTFIDAVQAYADGDVRSAYGRLQILHQRDTTDDAVLYYMGLCEFAAGRLEDSEKHLLQACAIDSTNSWYLGSLASMYNTVGRERDAAVLCEKLVKMNPASYRNTYTLTMIGDVKLNERRDSLALSYYEQALELDPDYAPAELGKAEVLRITRNYPAYFLSLGRFLRNEFVEPQMKSDYLKSLIGTMDARFYWVWGEQLNKVVDDCLEMHPQDIQSHINKMTMSYIKRDTSEVIRQCEQIIPIATEAKDTTNLMMAVTTIGDTYHEMGRDKEAFKLYEQAIIIDPTYCPALNNYAYYLSLKGKKLKKALKMSKITIEAEPDNATYLDTYAWLLYLTGNAEEAKPYFKHAMIYGGKDSAAVLEHYSIVLEALGEKDLSVYYKSLSEQKK